VHQPVCPAHQPVCPAHQPVCLAHSQGTGVCVRRDVLGTQEQLLLWFEGELTRMWDS